MPSEGLTFGNNKDKKIAELRQAILKAEKAEDEEKVVLLEAELRALEKNAIFNKEEFIEKRKRSLVIPKHKVLKSMQNLHDIILPENDVWRWDGSYEKEDLRSYDFTFENLLKQFEVKSFPELVNKKSSELKRKIKVLDLFGGAYFLKDFENISKIVGVRLKNIDEIPLKAHKDVYQSQPAGSNFELKEIIKNPKRSIIQGNLYEGSTWKELKNLKDKLKGFDIVVCRPEGPFTGNMKGENISSVKDNKMYREEIFITLLNRTLELLSKEGGVLMTQVPNLGTNPSISKTFWDKYIKEKENEGYEFMFDPHDNQFIPSVFAVKRNNKEMKK